MGRHDFFSQHAPRPSRVRFAISRAAAVTLVLGVILWIAFSILFAPPPQSEELAVVEAAGPSTSEPAAESVEATGPSSSEPAAESTVTVHVVGAVQDPGVYQLPPGARVIDAIDAAGGMTKDASPELLNLASPVTDGQQIVLPGAEHPSPAGGEEESQTAATPQGAAPPTDGKIPINQADAETLTQLPGIGPAIAGRIIDFREKNGPFSTVDELEQVSGIGPVIMGKIKDLVQAP